MVRSLSRLSLVSKAPSPPTLLLHVLSLLLLFTHFVSADPVAVSLQPSNQWRSVGGVQMSTSRSAYATFSINTSGTTGSSTVTINIGGYNQRGIQYESASFSVSMDGQRETHSSSPVTMTLSNNHVYQFVVEASGSADGLVYQGVDWTPGATTGPGTTTSSESSTTTTNTATETTNETTTSTSTGLTSTPSTST
jgi:hypothetical protein